VSGGFGFALGFLVGIIVTMVAVAAGATGHPIWSVAALAVAVAGVSAVTTPLAAIGSAVVCWALHDGFVLGRHGDLVATVGSLSSAIVLMLSATITVVVAAAVRVGRDRRVTEYAARHIPAQRRPAGEGDRDTVLR
jgi:hypothetical protein